MRDPWLEQDEQNEPETVIEKVKRVTNLPIVHGKYVDVWRINNGNSRVYQIVKYENGSVGNVQVNVYRVKIGEGGHLYVSKECSLNPNDERSLSKVGIGLHYQNLREIKKNPCFPDELRDGLEKVLKAIENVLALKEQEYRESRAILVC
ncbi:hypothetical protein KY307_02320 [Candidatus Woesearchaeota archaeon]|nr:hypothetical protein [Candidatus Woesearchaeota archaeon]